jgi:zinc D-Ala-D-Ala carboxypeptidase
MKRIIGSLLLLTLTIFFPLKSENDIFKKDDSETIQSSNKKDSDEVEWIVKGTQDTSKIEEIVIIKEDSEKSTSNWWEYPNDIFTTQRDGSDLLVLVNKQYKLPSNYAPSDLVKASNSGIRRGENYQLRNILIPDLTNMINDAKSDGIDLSIVSAYRSFQTQKNTYNYWLSKNNNNIALVDTFSARPGHSQHQLGTAIDFSTNEISDRLGDEFASTKASNWLVTNAHKYGFVISYPKGYEHITGYKFESWHYRYIGKEYTQEMISTGLILELYLQDKTHSID